MSSLRESGLSIRAIESATGISRKTVIKDIHNQVVESTPPGDEPVDVEVDEDALAEELITTTPTPVIGKDGKTYQRKPQPKPPAAQQEPLVDNGIEIGEDLLALAAQLGIHEDEFADCLAMAEGAPTEEEFERVLADAREQGDLSQENIVRLCRERTANKELTAAEYDEADEIAPGITGRQLNSINRKAGEPPKTLTPSRPRRKPITDTALTLDLELDKITRRINRFREDDRLARNAKSLSHVRSYLSRLTSACQQLDKALEDAAAA